MIDLAKTRQKKQKGEAWCNATVVVGISSVSTTG